MRAIFIMVATLGLTATAQDFNFQKVHPDSGYCPREEIDQQAVMGANAGRNYSNQRDTWIRAESAKAFTIAERKDGSGFVAYTSDGKPLKLSSLKGKVVVLGIFSTACIPSIRLLDELAQLQPKGAQMGFEIIPVHLESWLNVSKLVRQNSKFFEKTMLYKNGLGSEGLLNLGPELSALPTVVILDREGRIAWRWVGITPGFLVSALRLTLQEKSTITAAPPTPKS